MATGFFAADAASAETTATGKCTKCGSLKADDWNGCPLDGFCPAPDYGRRHQASGKPFKTRPAPAPRVYSDRDLAEARRYTDADYDEVRRNLYPRRD